MEIKEKISAYIHRKPANACERESFEKWLVENASDPDINQSLYEVFLDSGEETPKTDYIENSFEKLLLSMGGNYGFFQKKYTRTKKLLFATVASSVFGVLALIFAAWTLAAHHPDTELQSDHLVEWQELYVPAGKIDTLVMNDGSTFYLNSNTRITYPKYFQKENPKREIFIDGEVYAEVTKNPEQPLIIHGINNDIKVLGTSFCYSNYRHEDRAALALLSGQLQMSLRTTDGKQRIVEIIPGTKIHVNKKSGAFHVGDFDISLFHTFHNNGGLKFDNCKLSDIVKILERKYAVSILIEDPQLADTKYFAVISQSNSALEILESLNTDNEMKIKQNNNNKIITISQSN